MLSDNLNLFLFKPITEHANKKVLGGLALFTWNLSSLRSNNKIIRNMLEVISHTKTFPILHIKATQHPRNFSNNRPIPFSGMYSNPVIKLWIVERKYGWLKHNFPSKTTLRLEKNILRGVLLKFHTCRPYFNCEILMWSSAHLEINCYKCTPVKAMRG